jgi:hypothetical protein
VFSPADTVGISADITEADGGAAASTSVDCSLMAGAEEAGSSRASGRDLSVVDLSGVHDLEAGV